MYVIRSPSFNFMTLLENILSIDFAKTSEPQRSLQVPKSLLTHLQGRMFASCSSVIDLLNIHDPLTVKFMKNTITISINALST